MKKQETMRIAVYCRVATEAQLTDQSSEKEQIKRLQAIHRALHYTPLVHGPSDAQPRPGQEPETATVSVHGFRGGNRGCQAAFASAAL